MFSVFFICFFFFPIFFSRSCGRAGAFTRRAARACRVRATLLISRTPASTRPPIGRAPGPQIATQSDAPTSIRTCPAAASLHFAPRRRRFQRETTTRRRAQRGAGVAPRRPEQSPSDRSFDWLFLFHPSKSAGRSFKKSTAVKSNASLKKKKAREKTRPRGRRANALRWGI